MKILSLLVALLLVAITGCSQHYLNTAVRAVSPGSTDQAQGQYRDLEVELESVSDLIQVHLSEMALDDRIALQIAHVESVRAIAKLDGALSGEPPDVASLKSILADGIQAYNRSKPVLVRNKALFTDEEWRALVEANLHLLDFGRTLHEVRDAEMLKKYVKIGRRLLEAGLALAL